MKNWFKKTFGKKEEKKNQVFTAVKNESGTSLSDQQTVEYLQSELPNPTQNALSKLIENTESIIISKKEANGNKKEKVPITINGITTEIEANVIEDVKIHEVTDPKEIQSIRKVFVISDESKGHLMAVGDYAFDFIDKQGSSIKIEYLGFGAIRIEKIFKNDAELKKPIAFLNWLASIGISGPLNQWVENEKANQESDRRIQEWKSVAPQALVKSMEAHNLNPFGGVAYHNIFNELNREIPGREEQVLALFKLYGTGFYNWNGVPVYETIPLNMLLLLNTTFLNGVLEKETLDKEHLEGAARYFSSWDFSQKKKADLGKLSEKVIDKLFNYLTEMGNEEKLGQFVKRVKRQ